MKIESLFQAQLSDLLDGEKQLEAVLPLLLQGIEWAPLRLTLLQHQDLTRKHEKRLELIFWNLGVSPLGRKCKTLREIVREVLMVLETTPNSLSCDFEAHSSSLLGERSREGCLIELLQKANGYETASYSTLSVWADILGYSDVIRPLELSLQEARAMQRWLSNLTAQHAVQVLPPASDFAPGFSAPVHQLAAS